MMKKSNVFKSINENWIQVITGPMFSGKTTELLSFIERYSYAGINALGVMNEIDTRSNDDFIHSRNGHKLKAIKVKKSIDILEYVIKNELKNKIQIIAIDEVQFFDSEIVDVIKKLAKMKFIVICSGLDLDYNGNTFGQMPNLLAVADNVIKLTAICSVCGGAATKTYLTNHKKTKKTNDNPIVMGDTNMFEARCNKHFVYKTK